MLLVGHGGYCSAVTRDGWRWIVDAHRGDGRRYIVSAMGLHRATTSVGQYPPVNRAESRLPPLYRRASAYRVVTRLINAAAAILRKALRRFN